ncbi:hypothetical protein Hypma_008379 [Hypsizygus marmoreus]|uniref:F-box domain-containing protein n=1 Tax=Hypsizygus marmoreus TaxID=39966 RepID=A0A369JXN2_HYPMA|nr:hypothetical protein Hypma_008379 [Hypsizygus marmoreus]
MKLQFSAQICMYSSLVQSDTFSRPPSQVSVGKKKFWDLRVLLDLPLDLIYEIFGHLHPLDVYNIAQTTKALQNIILERNSRSLWKTVYERHPDIPQCPPHMPEPAWTMLIFIPSVCEECGDYRVFTDFSLRRRLCQSCADSCYVRKHPLEGAEPGPFPIDHIVWTLLPFSCRSDEFLPWAISTELEDHQRRYNSRDVEAMANTVARFKQDIAEGRPGAEEDFARFNISTKKALLLWTKHADECIMWSNRGLMDACKEYEDVSEDLIRRMKERLENLGYNDMDMDEYELSEEAKIDNVCRLTRRAWRKIRPRLEAQVTAQRDRRLRFEREILIERRKVIIKDGYDEYKKTLQPSTWKHLPHHTELFAYDAFSDLLNLPSDSDLTVPMCSAAFEKLPEYHAHQRECQVRELVSMLPDTDISMDDPLATMTQLGLCTSIFTCIRCAVSGGVPRYHAFGWEDVRTHNWCPRDDLSPGQWAFSAVGSRVAAGLARFLDLDPQTTSMADMDQVNARFVCAQCPIVRYRGVFGRQVLTWRESVIHAIQEQSGRSHRMHSWHLLTPETTAVIKHHEDKHPNPSEKAWSCNHCSLHFLNFTTRKDAYNHVKDIHSIDTPTEDIDFLYHYGPTHEPRRPVGLSQNPPAEYRCGRCPDLGFRLFIRERLGQHLLDKHGIENPVDDEDIVKVTHILKTSTAE